jgi:hypothetical protein
MLVAVMHRQNGCDNPEPSQSSCCDAQSIFLGQLSKNLLLILQLLVIVQAC